jgi:hypothetical protein
MGGSDDPSNLIELTIEEHAEAHRKLYEQHGHWQDKVAWQGLLGLIGYEEIMEEMYAARRGTKNPKFYEWYNNLTEEQYKEWTSKLSKAGKGKPKPPGFREKMSKIKSGSGNHMFGKTSPNKGKKQPCSEEKRLKHPLLKTVIYRGVEYKGLSEAARQNNTSVFFIKKEATIK